MGAAMKEKSRGKAIVEIIEATDEAFNKARTRLLIDLLDGSALVINKKGIAIPLIQQKLKDIKAQRGSVEKMWQEIAGLAILEMCSFE